MTSYLYWPIAFIRYFETYPLTIFAESNVVVFGRNYAARHFFVRKLFNVDFGEQVLLRRVNATSIHGQFQIAVVGSDGLINRDEMGAGAECAFDLQPNDYRDC